MRINVVVMDDQGQAYGGEAHLKVFDHSTPDMPPYAMAAAALSDADYELPLRPFIKRFGAKMSGPKRFVLLLAHLAHGKTGIPVQVAELQKAWNSMVGMMGVFNTAYPTRAKDNGWGGATTARSY